MVYVFVREKQRPMRLLLRKAELQEQIVIDRKRRKHSKGNLKRNYMKN